MSNKRMFLIKEWEVCDALRSLLKAMQVLMIRIGIHTYSVDGMTVTSDKDCHGLNYVHLYDIVGDSNEGEASQDG